jgi:hypothetical protein
MPANYKRESRKEWSPVDREITNDDIRTGALQRIADVAESRKSDDIWLHAEMKRLQNAHKRLLRRVAKLEGR